MGPQGAPGPQGPAGPQGPPGPAGGGGSSLANVRFVTGTGDPLIDTTALQTALDEIQALPQRGIVYVEGHCRVSEPLRIHATGTTLLGTGMGPFEPAATIEAHGYHGPVISLRTTVNPLPMLPLGDALAAGPGQAQTCTPVHGEPFIDFLNAAVLLDGLTAFTAELFFRLDTPTLGGGLLNIQGSRFAGEGHSITCHISTDTGGALTGMLNVGGTLVQIPVPGVVTAEATHHVALTYNGGTVRLFLDGALVGAQAASGPVQHQPHEAGGVGAVRDFLGGGAAAFGITGRIDSVRLSNVARYTAPFTAPTIKHAHDGATLLLHNFDGEVPGFSTVLTDQGSNRTWLPVYPGTTDGTLLTGVEIGRLALRAGRGMGVWALDASETYYHDLFVWGGVHGLYLWRNPFLNRLSRIKVADNGQGRTGIVLVQAAGICHIEDVVAIGYAYPLYLSDGSGSIANVFTHGQNRIPVVAQQGKWRFSNIVVSNEDGGALQAASMALAHNISVLVESGELEAYAAAHPAIIINGGDVVTLLNTVAIMHGASTEVVKVQTPLSNSHVPLFVNPSFGVGPAKPWSLSPHTVIG